MRTVIHIILILLIGTGIGLAIRSMQPKSSAGPGPDDVVYSNDPSDAPVENPDPVKPPHDEEWLSRFELTERSGQKVTSEQLLGQPYLVSFFFSKCPSVCIQQNQKIKELQDQFDGQGVRFVAITVDPANDTPEALREYAARFGADEEQWLFMTGDLTYIRRIGAEVFQQPIAEQLHTERFVLVDAKGEIEGVYVWSEPKQYEKLQESIRKMLKSAKS